jgi:hypothetical protein
LINHGGVLYLNYLQESWPTMLNLHICLSRILCLQITLGCFIRNAGRMVSIFSENILDKKGVFNGQLVLLLCWQYGLMTGRFKGVYNTL